MFFSQQPVHLARADELRQEPPKGSPYSVALPGTEEPGRSRIYRAYSAQEELVRTLDPQVRVGFSALCCLVLTYNLLGSHCARPLRVDCKSSTEKSLSGMAPVQSVNQDLRPLPVARLPGGPKAAG